MSDHSQRPDTDETPHDDAFIEAELADAARHEPIVDAEDAPGDEGHDRLQKTTDELNQLGDNLAKAAADAAYATIGLVGVVSDRVKEYYSEQKKQYAAAHPELTEEPTAKHLLGQFNDQLDGFVGDIGRLFRDLADRGRAGARLAAEDAADIVEAASDQVSEVAEDAADIAEAASDQVSEAAAEAVREAADNIEIDPESPDRTDR